MKDDLGDHGLLKGLRVLLMQDQSLKEQVEDRVYLNLPPKPLYPCLLIEVQSIHNTGVNTDLVCRIELSVKLLTLAPIGLEPLRTGHALNQLLDGNALILKNGGLANFRKTSEIIDLPLTHPPYAVQQFYQAVIWRIPYDAEHR